MADLRLVYEQVMTRLSLFQLLMAFGFVLAGLVSRRLVLYGMGRYAERAARRTRTEADDLLLEAVSGPLGGAALLLGLYFAVHSFHPVAEVRGWIDTFFSVLVSVLLSWFLLRLVNVLTHFLKRWAERTASPLETQLVPLVGRAAKGAVAILAVLLVLQNMGYSISGLIAGLGVGGLAVALAAQKTLSDLFGSMMLLVDRPFVLGDWIRSPDGNVEGVVERIGFRSTRIRTFDQTLVTIPNSRLADFVIDNVTLRPARRVWITVRVAPQATAAQMREAVGRIESILKAHPDVEPSQTLMVRFTDFGEFSRDIMVYYFTRPTAWAEYLRVREEVNLQILAMLEEAGLPIALPGRTVHLVQDATRAVPGAEDKTPDDGP